MKGNETLKEYYKQFKQNKLNKKDYNQYTNSNNITLIKSLKEEIESLEKNKCILEEEISLLRKNIKNIKKDEKMQSLEKIRNETKKKANHYLHICSQLAEEVIILRDKLDKYSNLNK